jgi:hypothetical protein
LAALVAAPTIAAAQEYRGDLVYHQNFDVAAGGRLDVRVADADVRILPGGDRGVEVTTFLSASDSAWGRERYDEMAFEAHQSGTTVVVSAREPRHRNHGWSRRSWFRVLTEIRVPLRFDVAVNTGDGDVSVGTLTGSLDVRTSDGDIDLADVQGPAVALHTSDGDIITGALRTTTVVLETSDGDIDVGSAGGDVRVRTSDGDVDIALAGAGPVTITTGDGDVRVSVPPGFAASVDLTGEDVDLAAPIQVTGRLSRGQIRGTLHGGGPEIRVRTGDGSVSLVERAGR